MLTVLLALVYFGAIVLLQAVLNGFTGQSESPLVIVVSTLSIAALFNPLRHRIQDFIDRRFYRRKYDAEQASFTQIARKEIELDNLTGAMLNVIEDTMQPESLSIWFIDPPIQRWTSNVEP